MDILEEYLYNRTLSKERVLDLVDEWTMYCFYLGYEPELRTAYSSPLDDDKRPSFSVFESRIGAYDYLWKDNGKRMVSGSIFKLIMLMYGYTSYEEVYQQIASDFEIDDYKVDRKKIVDKTRPISKPATRIRIKSKPFTQEALEFWRSFYIDEKLLAWKQVKQVEYVWFNDEQQSPIKVKEMTFAYPEWNKKYKEWRYQLYAPYGEFKFRNDLGSNQVYGYNHLLYLHDSTLVLTKSNKDILCLKKFGVEAISPRSETTLIKRKTVEWFKTRYSRVKVFFDNDAAGIEGASRYDLESVMVPIDSGCKDFSDYLKMYGEDKARVLLNELLR